MVVISHSVKSADGTIGITVPACSEGRLQSRAVYTIVEANTQYLLIECTFIDQVQLVRNSFN